MKNLVLSVLVLALAACTYKNDISGKNIPKQAAMCKVYNGSGLIVDMQHCKFKIETVRNKVVMGCGESWLICSITGIDNNDPSHLEHTYQFLDSEALTILWEN